MNNSMRLDTAWEIQHTDPAFPGMVTIRVFTPNQTDLMQLTLFPRDIFLEFADQINQVANAIRSGLV